MRSKIVRLEAPFFGYKIVIISDLSTDIKYI